MSVYLQHCERNSLNLEKVSTLWDEHRENGLEEKNTK